MLTHSPLPAPGSQRPTEQAHTTAVCKVGSESDHLGRFHLQKWKPGLAYPRATSGALEEPTEDSDDPTGLQSCAALAPDSSA